MAAGSASDGPIKPEVFIGRLPPGTTKEQVESWCEPYEATAVRLLEGKGCGFASFATFAQAERAIEALSGLHGGDSGGEGLNVELADFKGAPRGAEKRPKVFIGSISKSCTEEAVSQHCSRFGAVTYAKIFSKGGGSPPCAFATFGSFMEAERCIAELNGSAVPGLSEEGKTLTVQWADVQKPAKQGLGPPLGWGPAVAVAAMGGAALAPAAVPLGRGRPPGPGGLEARGGPVLAMYRPPGPPYPSSFGTGAAGGFPGVGGYVGGGGYPYAAAGGYAGGGASRKVFIGGLGPEATEDFILGMMAPYGEIVEAKILRKPGKDPCGFVRFATDDQGEDSIATLGARGRFTVEWASDRGAGPQPGGAAGAPRKRPFDGAFTP